MPAKSPEALQRKAAKRKAKKTAARIEKRFKFNPHAVRKGSPSYRRQLPKIPEMRKADLRAMLAAAVKETAAISQNNN